MGKVDIYDISSGAWYTQTTTGDPTVTDNGGFPNPRMIGCVVAASAPDNSSHNIYMYGGGGSYLSGGFDEIWVLSLPMFRWTRVFTGSLPLFGNTCHMAGNKYMLSVGGYREAGGCMVFLGLFDASELQWVPNYQPSIEYYIPPKIASIVGGTSQGGAKVTSPEAGWGSNVEAVFHPQTTGGPPPSNPTSTPSPKTKSKTPAILGGVLGGLLCLGAVLALILILLRRRRQREKASHSPKPPALSTAEQGAGSTWNHPPQELDAGIFHGGARP